MPGPGSSSDKTRSDKGAHAHQQMKVPPRQAAANLTQSSDDEEEEEEEPKEDVGKEEIVVQRSTRSQNLK